MDIPEDFRKSVVVGPLLCFRGQDIESFIWKVSLMIGINNEDDFKEPEVKLNDSKLSGNMIYSSRKEDFQFYTFDFNIEQSEEEKYIQYFVNSAPFEFIVPGKGQSTRWAFWSCNGYQSLEAKKEFGGIQPMWRNLLNSGKIHLMYGGGDQIYMDGLINEKDASGLPHDEGLFSIPILQEWINLPKDEMMQQEFTDEHYNQVYDFAMQHYIDQFTVPEFSSALASIPYIMNCDDHDFWDGIGSHEKLNDIPVGIMIGCSYIILICI